jgi:hypothetical protein
MMCQMRDDHGTLVDNGAGVSRLISQKPFLRRTSDS